MTDTEVQKLVEQLSASHFALPFMHNAYFNSRLKTTGGRYLLRTHDIELNRKLYNHFGIDELKGIILHELCHYHLHIRGMGYKHRDADFRALLKKVGAPRFCSIIEETHTKRKFTLHIYQCESCDQHYNRKRRMDISKYHCGKCGRNIRYVRGEERWI